MLSRRLFLMISSAIAALLTVRRSVAAELLFVRPLRKELPRLPLDAFTEKGKSLVGVAGSGSVEQRVQEAVTLIGGFGKLNVKGKTVLVKPNVVSGSPSPVTTSPEVVAAVVRLLYREGAREVLVGDMSALLKRVTLKNMKKCGIRQAAEGAGARVIAFEDAGWIEVALPGAHYVKKVLVTEWLYRADVIVNLPVVKTHRSASYSICLKNFIGCTHLQQRPYLVDRDHWEELVADFRKGWIELAEIKHSEARKGMFFFAEPERDRRRCSYGNLGSTDLPSMSHRQGQDNQPVIVNLTDNAIITDPVAPQPGYIRSRIFRHRCQGLPSEF